MPLGWDRTPLKHLLLRLIRCYGRNGLRMLNLHDCKRSR